MATCIYMYIFLEENNIKHIKARVKHPKRMAKSKNGMIRTKKFVNWYNTVRYHESLDTDHYLMTLYEAFWTRLPEECKLNMFLERMERELNVGKQI